jgi:hypothetical protein
MVIAKANIARQHAYLQADPFGGPDRLVIVCPFCNLYTVSLYNSFATLKAFLEHVRHICPGRGPKQGLRSHDRVKRRVV